MFVWAKSLESPCCAQQKTDQSLPPNKSWGAPFGVFGLDDPSRTGVPTGGANGCSPYFGHGAGTEHFAQSSSAPPCPTLCGNQGFSRVLLVDTSWLRARKGNKNSKKIALVFKKHQKSAKAHGDGHWNFSYHGNLVCNSLKHPGISFVNAPSGLPKVSGGWDRLTQYSRMLF